MLRNTPNNESIIVEYGFADSKGDDVNQIKNNWKELTEAVVRALASYVGVPYTPPNGQGNMGNYYVVKKGDTLYGIARSYGISVDELKAANNLTSNTLTVGSTLVIPSKQNENTSQDYYIVQPGDTLYKIANKYNMTVNELKTLNNLTNNVLNIGQRLKVVKNDMPAANVYIVISGDSLYSIAKRYGVSVDELKRVNNKTSNLLTIGESLKIPLDNQNNYYTVKSGDSLWSISQKFNTTVDNLKRLNNLNSNILSIGMNLKISQKLYLIVKFFLLIFFNNTYI